MRSSDRQQISRRAALGMGGALVAGAGLTVAAGRPPQGVTARYVRNLTGPAETGPYQAAFTDLAIPARCPDGSLLLVGGDTFTGKVGGTDWRAPVGLRSSCADPRRVRIDGSVGGDHARSLIPDDHEGGSTCIPSDVFTVGRDMYLHVMRGVIFQADTTELWRSRDDGETWSRVISWDAALHGGAFQQKSFALPPGRYAYLLSSVFNRGIVSALLLHRVPKDRIADAAAYEPWGRSGGRWSWGHAPTTVNTARDWGEICFRAIDGRFVFTWLNLDSDPIDIRAQVFRSPTSNLFRTPEQTMIVNDADTTGNRVRSPYGGFVFPGSHVDDLYIAVSQWPDASPTKYHVMEYRVTGLRG